VKEIAAFTIVDAKVPFMRSGRVVDTLGFIAALRTVPQDTVRDR